MHPINRRSFLAASAALAAVPTAPALPASGDVDVVVVGAGAAGIAAARLLASGGRRVAVIEAAGRVGGRCITDSSTFGVPFDRGAHAIHNPDVNAVLALAGNTDLEVYPAPPGQRVRIGRRMARENELEKFLATLVRASRAIADGVRTPRDMPAGRLLPKDMGAFGATAAFVLGPYARGADLDAISAIDLSRAPERDSAAFCRQGYGTLLARLAQGLPVQLGTVAKRIEWNRRPVEVETNRGTLRARAVVVTVSTDVLKRDVIRFTPGLPKRHQDALGQLSLGCVERVAIAFEGNPLGLADDERVFEQAQSARTAALLANVGGTALSFVDVGGRFGRELAEAGDTALTAFAIDWLADLFGENIRKAVTAAHATGWLHDPLIGGAMSVAAPGGHPARRLLMEPIGDRIWLAGEAMHENLAGTVEGAWESGERAAEAVLKRMPR